MITINKILVPTDFSENASVIHHPVRQLAERYGATVDFIHIIPTQSYFSEKMTGLVATPLSGEELYGKLKEQASASLNKIMDEYLTPEIKGKGIVEIASNPARSIAEYADAEGYDMIMMAAKGQHSTEFFRGSTTQKVMRYSDLPVFSIEQSDLGRLQNILVPTDGTAGSLKALPIALSFALMYDARITLYNVMVLRRPLLEGASEEILQKAYRRIRDEVLTELEDFLAQSDDYVELQQNGDEQYSLLYHDGEYSVDINLKTVIQNKVSKYDGITEFAREKADILIMATHGRSGLSRLLYGSVAEEVAGELELPVITVRTGPVR